MQILVVVASIQVGALKTDVWRRVPCEQQLNMGQSVLRDRTIPCEGRVMLTTFDAHLVLSKGNQVNIPEPAHGDRPRKGVRAVTQAFSLMLVVVPGRVISSL